MRFILSILAALALIALPAAAATTKQTPATAAEVTLSFAPLVKETAPAVVNVYAQQIVAQREMGLFGDPFFRQFFGNDGSFGRPRERVQNSLGSGVIVDASGLIVTNNHVVKGGTNIRVVLADKREFEAQLLLTDERTDLAVLKIDAGEEELPALALGDSDDLEVGDLVLAIGNPFGVGQTVTSGIVSALARTDVGITDYQFFIQTDAAINPGNSGGALIDMAGELVGINTAIFSRSGGSIGIGFAIPANMVKTVVLSAETGKVVKRPWLGADFQDVTAEIAESIGFARPEGALVVKLVPQGPLAKAGLKRGDVILAFNGRTVENARELRYRAATAAVGGKAVIEFQRGSNRREAAVALVAAPESVAREETKIAGKNPLAGAVAANLSPAVADELGLRSDATGVAVTAIEKGPAQRFFRKGDVLLEINGTAITSVSVLQDVLAADEGYWRIAIRRGGRVLTLAVGG
ncbi:MAG: DegQ family serine endoprotease [Alphaproteobacteria bacterium]|nr:DegQ family serine endoprotease [Alphaproteobacteria bacterium]